MVNGHTLECIIDRYNPGRSVSDPGDHNAPVPNVRGLTTYHVDGVEVVAEQVAQLLGIDVPTLERINALCDPA